MLLKDFMTKLFTVTGADQKVLKDLFENEELGKIDVPNEQAAHVQQNLLTRDAAKSDKELISHFRALNLNGVDQRIEKLIDELGLSDEHAAPIKSNENSYEKIGLLAKTIKELESKKAGANSGDKKALQEQIDKLHGEIKERNEQIQSVKNDYEQRLKNKDINYAQRNYLGEINYSDNLPKSDFITLMEQKVQNKLAENNYRLDLDESGKLLILDSEGNPAYENNEPVSYSGLRDKIAADNKYIKVSDDKGGDPTPPPNPRTSQPGSSNTKASTFHEAAAKTAEEHGE